MTELTGAALIRAAAARCRELDRAATAGPWETGTYYLTAGVKEDLFGPGRCTFCRSSPDDHSQPLVWQGDADINGTRMLAHQHQMTTGWDDEGEALIWARQPDGLRVRVLSERGDAPTELVFIATFRGVAAPLADLLDGIADHTEHGGGQPQEPVYALCRAILEGQPE